MDGQGRAPVRLLVLPGDGIGPEIVEVTLQAAKAVDAALAIGCEYVMGSIGFDALKTAGTTLPADVLEAARAADGIILGPVQHNDYPPVEEGGLNPSGELRKRLDLFANIRPAATRPGLPGRTAEPFDLVVVRENTEGFYADRSMFLGPGEFMPTADLALSVRKVSRESSTRIAQEAFRLATRRRNKVTAVHKANVLRVSDGLFLECVRGVAAEFPGVEYEERIVDAMAALLVRDASAFDVILTTNMFGDILSDEASELSGSLGLAASINAGPAHVMAQAQHGAAPDIAGRDIANPTALIGSVAMLFAWMGERRDDNRLRLAGEAVDATLSRVLSVPEWRTADLGGPLGTKAFGERVLRALPEAVADTRVHPRTR